ncbi:MAG: hypothetical protein ABI601_08470 [bacterium]
MLLTLTLLSALHAASPADSLAGTWKFTNEVAGTNWSELCTFKQAGTALTGSCVGDTGVPATITGELKAGTVTFQHGGDYQGQEITIIFTGAVGTPGELKGTINVKPFDAAGSFTAAPAPDAKKG